MPQLTDIEIAQGCRMQPIQEIAARAHVGEKYLEQYGKYKAKIDPALLGETNRPNGRLILVTAITPTPAGEGKTTTTIGLADGLRQIGKDAVVALQLEENLTYHDAGNDAVYTALIGAELVRRFGALPTEAELNQMEAELRRQRREQAATEAGETLDQLLRDKEPVYHRSCGVYKTTSDCLRSRNARVVRCPKCDSWLCNGNWLQVQDYYVARSRCLEHGRFYTCVTVQKGSLGTKGTMHLYSPEDFPPDLFRLCKLGGQQIPIGKSLKKRKRARRKRKVKAVTPQ